MKKWLLLIGVLAGGGVAWQFWPEPSAVPSHDTSTLPWHQYPTTQVGELTTLPAVTPVRRTPAPLQPAGSPNRTAGSGEAYRFQPSAHYLDTHAGHAAVQHSAYQDRIHPDENLLRQAAPEANAQPIANPAVSEPVAVPASPAPAVVTPPPTPNPGPSTPPPTTRGGDQPYDKNQGPQADEDLLQGPGTTQPVVPPPDLQPPNAGPSTTPGAPSTPETPSLPETSPSQPETLPPPQSMPPADSSPSSPPPASRAPGLSVTPGSSGSGMASPHSSDAPHGSVDVPPAQPGVDPHAEVFADTPFPSAKSCRACHEQIYDEWASSSHAYAAISPMFQKFEQTINTLTRGTIGYFCMRCHAPIATSLGLPRYAPIDDSVPAAKEGVTCVACHRVKYNYGKVNGERRIERGPVTDPVYGSGYGEGLREVLSKRDYYKVKLPGEEGAGQEIHQRVIHFEQISSSHFCAPCHQVAVYPGIALEVVWAQYRASPAHKQGITCQECHMGREPGVAAGYDCGPVAVVNGKPVSPERKHSNHLFYGPGYSIAHPGTFPFNPDADDWSIEEWLQFDYRAGWGTEPFEDMVDEGRIQVEFPPVWANVDDRYDARDIVNENLEKLEAKRHLRHRLMENGSHLEGPVFRKRPQVNQPLNFHYVVTNLNIGHNMPSGSLGAQPQLWLNVALTGPNGRHLWESGYVDANGDLADMHSLQVADRLIPPDQQLFNLQTKFLITTTKGTDREMYLPINADIDQLPFIRPSAFPISVMNHPPFIRMEAHSIPPTGSRRAKYRVPAHLLGQPGTYRLTVRMRSRAEPIYFMRYCRATPDMERNMNEWMLDFHEQSFDFVVH